MPVEKTLSGLVETWSYKLCRERLELWTWILEAICNDQWFDEVAQDGLATARSLLQAIKMGGGDPSNTPFGRKSTASEAAFDKWLRETLRQRQFPAHLKQRAGRKPNREAVADFLVKRGGRPGETVKELVREIKEQLGITVSERTVRRARGGK
jgi:hypothetical protein